jgi:hypothetical protein
MPVFDTRQRQFGEQRNRNATRTRLGPLPHRHGRATAKREIPGSGKCLHVLDLGQRRVQPIGRLQQRTGNELRRVVPGCCGNADHRLDGGALLVVREPYEQPVHSTLCLVMLAETQGFEELLHVELAGNPGLGGDLLWGGGLQSAKHIAELTAQLLHRILNLLALSATQHTSSPKQKLPRT